MRSNSQAAKKASGIEQTTDRQKRAITGSMTILVTQSDPESGEFLVSGETGETSERVALTAEEQAAAVVVVDTESESETEIDDERALVMADGGVVEPETRGESGEDTPACVCEMVSDDELGCFEHFEGSQ